MLIKKLLLPALLSIAFAATTHAETVAIDTSFNPLQTGTDNQGWWSSTATNNNSSNDNYFTGDNDTFRSFFSFDLSNLSGTFKSATFQVRRYDQPTALTLGLFEVSTPASTLITTRTNIQDAAIFADLGSGDSYGSFNVAPGSSNDILSFTLNEAALSRINAAVGSGYFSIGAAVIGPGIIFSSSTYEPGNSGLGYTQRLVLDTTQVPEPSHMALVGVGLLVAATAARRKGAKKG